MKRKRRDTSFDSGAADRLDETLEATFPGSDAPANTVVTGVGEPRHRLSSDDRHLTSTPTP